MFFGALILPAPQYAPDLTLAKLHVPPEGLGIARRRYIKFSTICWALSPGVEGCCAGYCIPETLPFYELLRE
jgi:hypothetical protein